MFAKSRMYNEGMKTEKTNYFNLRLISIETNGYLLILQLLKRSG